MGLFAKANVFLIVETPRIWISLLLYVSADPASVLFHVEMFVNTLVQGLEFYGLRQYFNYAANMLDTYF